jgi:hypothetical protein
MVTIHVKDFFKNAVCFSYMSLQAICRALRGIKIACTHLRISLVTFHFDVLFQMLSTALCFETLFLAIKVADQVSQNTLLGIGNILGNASKRSHFEIKVRPRYSATFRRHSWQYVEGGGESKYCKQGGSVHSLSCLLIKCRTITAFDCICLPNL